MVSDPHGVGGAVATSASCAARARVNVRAGWWLASRALLYRAASDLATTHGRRFGAVVRSRWTPGCFAMAAKAGQLVHIVLFKWKPETTPAAADAIIASLVGLKAVIPVIVEVRRRCG